VELPWRRWIDRQATDDDFVAYSLPAAAACATPRSCSAETRAVLVLRFWADLPVEQVADILDRPLGTVKSPDVARPRQPSRAVRHRHSHPGENQ
jgi:DNA-directed RNA polymerase specialized sigma24 family protein